MEATTNNQGDNRMNTTTKRQFKTHNYRGVNMNRCHGGYYAMVRNSTTGAYYTAFTATNIASIKKEIDRALNIVGVGVADGMLMITSNDNGEVFTIQGIR